MLVLYQYYNFELGMRFRQKETAQDVVVCCCILHNMRKNFDTQEKQYSEAECKFQIQISEYLNRQPQPQLINVQEYVMENYFNI